MTLRSAEVRALTCWNAMTLNGYFQCNDDTIFNTCLTFFRSVFQDKTVKLSSGTVFAMPGDRLGDQ